jgi:hypothetical protein
MTWSGIITTKKSTKIKHTTYEKFCDSVMRVHWIDQSMWSPYRDPVICMHHKQQPMFYCNSCLVMLSFIPRYIHVSLPKSCQLFSFAKNVAIQEMEYIIWLNMACTCKCYHHMAYKCTAVRTHFACQHHWFCTLILLLSVNWNSICMWKYKFSMV